jgi:hypothetical protein
MRGRLPDAFAGRLGFAKALLASVLSLCGSMGLLVLLIFTQTVGNDVQDLVAREISGLFVAALYALFGAPLGAIAILVVDRSVARQARHSPETALVAAFLALAAYGLTIVTVETVRPTFLPMIQTLIDAYKEAKAGPIQVSPSRRATHEPHAATGPSSATPLRTTVTPHP